MDLSRLVLLIEEDKDLRGVFRGLLEQMNLWVVATARPEKMLHLFEVADLAHLLVSDVAVPDSESIALTEYLLARNPGLGAVLISTDDTEAESRRRFEDGRTRFLTKPFSIDELRQAVGDALALGSNRPVAVAANARRLRHSGVRAVRRSRKRLYAASGLAAAAVAVAVTGALLRGEIAPPPLPEQVESSVMRGSILELSEPVGDLSEVPRRLTWEEIADAASYRLRILAVDDSVVWEGASPAGTVTLAPEVTEALHPGVVYFWTVEALDAEGELLLRSETARFQVVPPRS